MEQENFFLEHEAIRTLDQLLQQQISVAGGSPFIAHYEIPLTLEEAASEELVQSVDGVHGRLFKLMLQFPCACTRIVAMSLADSYGGDGDSKVYEHIARRLGIGETIPLHHRNKLHLCFRSACQSQGLSLPAKTSESGRMVDDYLFQAGVSRNQLPWLAQAFLRAERMYGLPQGDDTRQVDDWEDRAVDFAPIGLKVLRRIVKEDPTGFHATTFVSLRRDADSPGASAFESAFSGAVRDQLVSDRESVSSDQPPSLEFKGGELQLAVPSGANALEVRVQCRVHRLSGGRNLALSLPWPSDLEWRSHHNGGSSPEWQTLPIFSGPSRILVFDGDSGRRKCELNPERPAERNAPAGLICLLAQRPFQANGEQSHQLGDRASVLYCEVSSALKIEIENLEFDIEVDPRLRLQVDGVRIIRNQHAWLLAKPTAVQVCGETGSTSADLEVQVKHSALEETLRVPVQSVSDGIAIARFSLPGSGEFDMARVSLHVQGQERALYRHKFWFWPGLDQLLDYRLFDAASIPNNLSTENLSHISLNSDGYLALVEDEAYLNTHGRGQPPRMHETGAERPAARAVARLADSGGGCKIGSLSGGKGRGPARAVVSYPVI